MSKQMRPVLIYWGSTPWPYRREDIAQELEMVVGGRYMDGLNQYGIDRGGVAGEYVYPGEPPAAGFTDALRDGAFRSAINDGHVKTPRDFNLGTEDPFYCLIVKPGYEHLLDPSLQPDVHTGGYHYPFNDSYWDGGHFDGQVCWIKADTSVSGTMQRLVHEMAEAYAGGEIADQCEGRGPVVVDGVTVPRYWSVADHRCYPQADVMPSRHSGWLIQGTYGEIGNYEMVVPMGDHLAHFWRNNDADGYPWHGPIPLPKPASGPLPGGHGMIPPTRFTAASVIETTVVPGNLDIVAALQGPDGESRLVFYGRDKDRTWHGPTELFADRQRIAGVTGSPALIQGTYGEIGNYEMVVPLGDHLAHFWRDNDAAGYPWHGPIPLPKPASGPLPGGHGMIPPSEFAGASVIETTVVAGNIDVVAAVQPLVGDSHLVFYGRDRDRTWHGPTEVIADGQRVSGVTGSPALIQGTYGEIGNYEMVVPLGDHLAHFWRDNDAAGYPWHGPIPLPKPAPPLEFLAVSFIQTNIIAGNLDVVAIAKTPSGGLTWIVYGRDSSGWQGPAELVADGSSVRD